MNRILTLVRGLDTHLPTRVNLTQTVGRVSTCVTLNKKYELGLGYGLCSGPVYASLTSKRIIFKSFSDF